MISLEVVYVLMGIMTAGVAVVDLLDRSRPRRWSNALFWGCYAVTFLAGTRLPHVVTGVLVIVMALVPTVRKLAGPPPEATTPAEREASAARRRNRLFIPALTIPAVTLLGTLTLGRITLGGAPLVAAKDVTLVALALAIVCALVVAMVMLRPGAAAPVTEARRLLDAVGWAAVLPQLLAALGAVFALAGVGQAVTTVVERWIPLETPFAVVAAYTVGMAIFTIIMGNAFAAFPVMTAGIGLPLIVQHFGGDVVVMSAVGMLSGFCGTLMTPMAANFNIVPAALLELPSEHDVIRVQIPTGLVLLATNTAIMYLFVFR